MNFENNYLSHVSNERVVVHPSVVHELDFIFRSLEKHVWDSVLRERPPKEVGDARFAAVDFMRAEVMDSIVVNNQC